MWKKQSLSIIICSLMALGGGQPVAVPRFNQLGYKQPQSSNSSGYNNNSLVPTTDRLGTTGTTTAAPPQFEYALLGQDPADQHWYRVSLTPADNKSGYRAQFATRKSPPYDAQEAHKHDKTINDMLNFLEGSEDHSLLKLYSQLLASEDYADPESKIKRNVDKIEIDMDNVVDQLKTDRDIRPVFLVGQLPGTATPTSNQNGSDSTMVKNFVYFIKGLK